MTALPEDAVALALQNFRNGMTLVDNVEALSLAGFETDPVSVYDAMAALKEVKDRSGAYPWKDGWIARLKELAGTLSAKKIAALMTAEFNYPFTSNGIIGKIHRLGLGKTRPKAAANQARSRAVKEHRVKKAAKRPPAPRKPVATKKIDKPADMSVFDGIGISLDDLTAKQCRWPQGHAHGATTYCGLTVAHKSYCHTHHLMSIAIEYSDPGPRQANGLGGGDVRREDPVRAQAV